MSRSLGESFRTFAFVHYSFRRLVQTSFLNQDRDSLITKPARTNLFLLKMYTKRQTNFCSRRDAVVYSEMNYLQLLHLLLLQRIIKHFATTMFQLKVLLGI
jgi:hypothetical protein